MQSAHHFSGTELHSLNQDEMVNRRDSLKQPYRRVFAVLDGAGNAATRLQSVIAPGMITPVYSSRCLANLADQRIIVPKK